MLIAKTLTAIQNVYRYTAKSLDQLNESLGVGFASCGSVCDLGVLLMLWSTQTVVPPSLFVAFHVFCDR